MASTKQMIFWNIFKKRGGLLQRVSFFDFSKYNCWKKNIISTLKWLFCVSFLLKKPWLKFQKLQHKFWSFPKIHQFWYPDPSLRLVWLLWLLKPSSNVLFWIFSIHLLKKIYPEPWNYSFTQFHAQKALLKVSKICNIHFWIENDPPPGTFLKIHPIWRSHPSLKIKSLQTSNKTL